MPLFFASLNSGSNGNCYYIGDEEDAILVDAGISCRETERRMARLGLRPDKIRAVFISHEHSDHTRGAEVLSRKHHIPVFITEETRKAGRLYLDPALVHGFESDQPVSFGRLEVHPFVKHHDGVDPHSFTIARNGSVVGVFTDIGRACENLAHHLRQCRAVFLEANYDEEMLQKGNYPWFLKQRIRGGQGHLSNKESLELFREYRSGDIQYLILSHLSANNNRPEIVEELFRPHTSGIHMEIASRYMETGLFCLE